VDGLLSDVDVAVKENIAVGGVETTCRTHCFSWTPAVDAALGTDTAGSVRIPAAFCGVVGFKPTYGMVPAEVVVDLSPSNDHVGVLGRDVRTAARLFEAIAGRASIQPETLAGAGRLSFLGDLDDAPARLRIGVPEQFMTVATEPVEAAVERALAQTA